MPQFMPYHQGESMSHLLVPRAIGHVRGPAHKLPDPRAIRVNVRQPCVIDNVHPAERRGAPGRLDFRQEAGTVYGHNDQ